MLWNNSENTHNITRTHGSSVDQHSKTKYSIFYLSKRSIKVSHLRSINHLVWGFCLKNCWCYRATISLWSAAWHKCRIRLSQSDFDPTASPPSIVAHWVRLWTSGATNALAVWQNLCRVQEAPRPRLNQTSGPNFFLHFLSSILMLTNRITFSLVLMYHYYGDYYITVILLISHSYSSCIWRMDSACCHLRDTLWVYNPFCLCVLFLFRADCWHHTELLLWCRSTLLDPPLRRPTSSRTFTDDAMMTAYNVSITLVVFPVSRPRQEKN